MKKLLLLPAALLLLAVAAQAQEPVKLQEEPVKNKAEKQSSSPARISKPATMGNTVKTQPAPKQGKAEQAKPAQSNPGDAPPKQPAGKGKESPK